ncbi:MAG: ABC transporter substrate-binding protein [Gemmatimonadetes bacterium]|jgi:branched-chain amino acid transport system substrate-binding protein|nr:ABC transporter substrate-binding protein [Gemmatimonadota bacterium]MBT4609455.1 ABC transporter substrate-binding protein [Gemmatimonadota bacterium]MBT5060392.1 ABC transporter substrate-binding protein [Gemmatimonadota bacterium]MBT5146047.1 ABC transporter substrate-binding protein [Gemmatimonadota bacterium]MBT5591874.1 ABC transporter substrate-binding protein [Gemmatimonadota bacterium]
MRSWIKSHCWLLGLLIASCGGDSGSTGPKTDETPILIGQLTTLTGALDRLGGSWRATATLAVDEINAGGGVLGRPLQLVVADSETDPDAAVAGAQSLVAQGVVAIVGPQISSAALRVAREVTIAANIPIISPSATAAEITGLEDNHLVWRTAASDILKGRIVADYAYEIGARRAGVIFVDNSFGRGLSEEFIDAFESLGGEVLNRVNYPELDGDAIETYDYRPHAEAVAAGEPDLIYVIAFGADGVKIMISSDGLVTDEYRPQFLSELAPSADLLPLVAIYEGLLGLEQQSPTTVSRSSFVSNYQDRYGGEPVQFADGLYDAIYLLALAMEQGGSTDAAVITANLQSVSRGGAAVNVADFSRARSLIGNGTDIDYEGASGAIGFDSNGDVTSGTFRVWKIENAAFADVTTITFP